MQEAICTTIISRVHDAGRLPNPLLLREHYSESEKLDMYRTEVLGIAALLGREHTFRRRLSVNEHRASATFVDPPPASPSDPPFSTLSPSPFSAATTSGVYPLPFKPLHLLPRDAAHVMLLESDRATAAAYPRNTLLVPPYDSSASGSNRAGDACLPLIRSFVLYWGTAEEHFAAHRQHIMHSETDTGAELVETIPAGTADMDAMEARLGAETRREQPQLGRNITTFLSLMRRKARELHVSRCLGLNEIIWYCPLQVRVEWCIRLFLLPLIDDAPH